MDKRTGSGRCCSMWESILVSESITHHPNTTSPLGDSLCLAPTIYWKGTPRTCEVNGALHRTTEPLNPWGWQTGAQFSRKLQVMVHCPAGVCMIYPVWHPPNTQSLTKLVHWFFTYDHYHYLCRPTMGINSPPWYDDFVSLHPHM